MTAMIGYLPGTAKVRAHKEKQLSEEVSLSDLNPDFFVRESGTYSGRIEAVHASKERRNAFRFHLEGGATFECAEGTVLAGVAGHRSISCEEHPIVVLCRQQARFNEGRRRFVLQLLGEETAPRWLARRMESKWKLGSGLAYYYRDQAYSAASGILNQSVRTGDTVTVCSGVEVDRPNGKLILKGSRSNPIFPLFRVASKGPLPCALAVGSESGEVAYAAVLRVEQFTSEGPWYSLQQLYACSGRRNAGHGGLEKRTGSALVNQVIVFSPDEFISQETYARTATPGEQSLEENQTKPIPRVVFVRDLIDMARMRDGNVTAAPVDESPAAQAARQVCEILGNACAAGISDGQLMAEFEKMAKPATIDSVPATDRDDL